MKGIVRNIVKDKGYGFISTSDQTDYFFHKDDFDGDWNQIQDDFYSKQIGVEFDISPSGSKGPRAMNVRRINEISTS